MNYISINQVIVKLGFWTTSMKRMPKTRFLTFKIESVKIWIVKLPYFKQNLCQIGIFANNYNQIMKLDTNPRLTLAQTLTLSTGDRNFDHFTCRHRYVTMISTFGYIFASWNWPRDPEPNHLSILFNGNWRTHWKKSRNYIFKEIPPPPHIGFVSIS